MTRRTKIVCTLGPATDGEERVEALIRAGMDVARLNFSHGVPEEHARRIALVRAVAARLERPVAILQDLQGPKIRTGALAGGAPVTLRDGQPFTITTLPVAGAPRRGRPRARGAAGGVGDSLGGRGRRRTRRSDLHLR